MKHILEEQQQQQQQNLIDSAGRLVMGGDGTTTKKTEYQKHLTEARKSVEWPEFLESFG